VFKNQLVGGSQRNPNPEGNYASLRAACQAFRADLDATYPGPANAPYVAMAAALFLTVERFNRRRARHAKESKYEGRVVVRAAKQLADALEYLRARTNPKPAELTPRQRFEATMRELEGRDKLPASQTSASVSDFGTSAAANHAPGSVSAPESRPADA
jgi:hypothetical protein